jgi:hypothetical protein
MTMNSTAIGTLVLKNITPVIHALFDPFQLCTMRTGDASIRWFDHEDAWSEDTATCGTWGEIHDNLLALAKDLGLTVEGSTELSGLGDGEDGEDEDEFSVPPVFDALMKHFKVKEAQRAEIHRCIEESADGESLQYWAKRSAEFPLLLRLATALNDRHGLASIACDCATLGKHDTYGTATFNGLQFVHGSNTTNELEWAEEVRYALSRKNLKKATNLLSGKVKDLLSGITDETVRTTITKDLIAALQASAA